VRAKDMPNKIKVAIPSWLEEFPHRYAPVAAQHRGKPDTGRCGAQIPAA
jgi:hypothetical protein